MNRSHTLAALLSSILSLAASSAGWSADLQGADRVIAKIQGTASTASTQLPRGPLADEFNAYKTELSTMTLDAAATGWLALLDKVVKLPSNPSYYDEATNPAAHLLALLPSPDSWKAIEDALQKRPPGTGDAEARELGWKLLGRILAADPAGQRDLLKPAATALNRRAGLLSALFSSRSGPTAYDQLVAAYLTIYPDAKLQLESFERSLATASPNRYGGIEVPDLLDIAGEAKTRELAKKALLGSTPLTFRSGSPTEKIFKQVALEQIDSLPAPHWELITTTDDVDLFLVFDKKFNKPAPTTAPDNAPPPAPDYSANAYSLRNVRGIYIMSLVYSGKIDDALKQAELAPNSADNAIFAQDAADSGHGDFALQFLEGLLSRHPELSEWDTYIDLAARTGQTDRMLAFVKKAADSDASPSGKVAAMNALRTAQLAADDVEPAIKELRAQLAADKQLAPDQTFASALLLTQLGTALQRPELQQEGIAAVHAALTASFTHPRNPLGDYVLAPFIKQLLLAHDDVTAEQVIAEVLSTNPRARGQRDPLVWLATLYSQAGRNDDVLILLQKAPWWQTADLSDIMSLRLDDEYPTLGAITAKALIAAGRNEEAKRILLALLDQHPAEDDPYELLLPLMPDRFPALCDKLYARDAFEERPLIWKAESLRRLKKLDDAETAARQAIAVDPSDGETPHGRRMKVYAVLSDILKDKGQTKDSENYAQVVAAIRTAETADDLYEIGLLKRAIARYEEALTHFADAYCIQSRLALKYSEAGLESLAEEHYQRAYELMPDSFGRVESHCFGCEGAFRGNKATSIAERVFTTMAKRSPMKPQIHYLLGYLHEEEDKIPEALANYQQAVKLDPDYFNAWKKNAELLDRLGRGPDERDPVIRNLARLDPLNRHGAADLRRLSTPADFWTLSAKARALAPDAGGATPKLFALDAAAKIVNADANLRERNFDYSQPGQQTPDDYDPHTFLKNQSMVQAAMTLQK